ncbi:MAG: zinc ribbon domain-containing protein [Candidatus Bathyarchaeia archaeon]
MSSKDKIDYEEKKAKRYKVGDKVFYIIDDIVESETEGGISPTQLSGNIKRGTKRAIFAMFVHDEDYGTMPYNIWEERTKRLVLGTISKQDQPTPQDIPHMDSISVAISGEVLGGKNCPYCGTFIPYTLSFCPSCGKSPQ